MRIRVDGRTARVFGFEVSSLFSVGDGRDQDGACAAAPDADRRCGASRADGPDGSVLCTLLACSRARRARNARAPRGRAQRVAGRRHAPTTINVCDSCMSSSRFSMRSQLNIPFLHSWNLFAFVSFLLLAFFVVSFHHRHKRHATQFAV